MSDMSLSRAVWVLLLPLVVAQNCTWPKNDMSEGTNQNSSNHVVDGKLCFADLVDHSDKFSLRKFLDDQNNWIARPYVALAKACMHKLISIDWEMIRSLVFQKQQLNPDVAKTMIMQVVKKNMKFFVLLALGLILGLLFWPIGFCFCVCRSLGKCGAKYTMDQAYRQSKACGFIVFLLSLSTLIWLLVSAGSLFSVGQRIQKTPAYIVNVMNHSIHDIKSFEIVLFAEVEQVAVQDLGFVVDLIVESVDDMPEVVTQPFMSKMQPRVTRVATSIDILSSATKQLNMSIDTVNEVIAEIQLINANLTKALRDMKVELVDIKTNECPSAFGVASTATPCKELPGSDDVPDVFNFSATPDLSDQKALLSDASLLNFDDVKELALEEFKNIPKMVNETTESIRTDIKKALRDAQSMIPDALANAKSSFSVAGMVEKSVPTPLLTMLVDHPLVSHFCKALMGIAVMIIFMVTCGLRGLLLGMVSCKKNPEYRNKTGGSSHRTLMGTVNSAFCFMPLYMIPGAVLFLVGAPLNMVCAPIRDLTIFSEIVDHADSPLHNILGKLLHPDKPKVVLAMGDVLKKCQHNTAVYSVLKLQQKIDVKTIVNIREQLPDLSSMEPEVNEFLKSVQFLNESDLDEFHNMTTSNAGNLNVTHQMKDILAGIDGFNMSELITLLDDATTHMAANTAIKTRFEGLSAKATDIENRTKPELQRAVRTLNLSLSALPENINDVINEVNNTAGTVLDIQEKLVQSGGGYIMEGVHGFVNNTIHFAEQFISHVDDRLKNDLAKCGVVWDLYDGITGSVCSYLLDAFNGFWFSLCNIGFFLIVHVIVATILVNYFRIDLIEEDPDEYKLEPI